MLELLLRIILLLSVCFFLQDFPLLTLGSPSKEGILEEIRARGISTLNFLKSGRSSRATFLKELGQILRENAAAYDDGKQAGNSGDLEEQTVIYSRLASQMHAKTICETGFNMGHSSVNWLIHSSPSARYFGFDAGELFHIYPSKNAALLNSIFGQTESMYEQVLRYRFVGELLTSYDRFNLHWGDSSLRVPQFIIENPGFICDIIHVDGGHWGKIPVSDLLNFKKISNENSLLIIDDVNCVGFGATSPRSGCKIPQEAWTHMIESGWVKQQACYRFAESRGFCFGKYLHANPSNRTILTPRSKYLTHEENRIIDRPFVAEIEAVDPPQNALMRQDRAKIPVKLEANGILEE
eukprot:CAMPEP_0196574568 /NCGR_PEP_ID=MMETSP1081-20130531/4268_1 /TAXON_ID=36882 /ORGANISM="Pyramimonas amylifera, Strain CCMP720" /LENGTH=351 /DNA_ID=CAMNT_0041892645 /DNA_START=178 /DNA_END=1234 /DNA_ORIENTATION=-